MNPQYSNPAPVIKPSGHKSALRIVFAVAAALVALLLGLIVLLLIGVETGPVALLIGLVCATIPVPLYLMLVLWIDRYESEPLWMLATAFFWGALVAVFIALIFNTAYQPGGCGRDRKHGGGPGLWRSCFRAYCGGDRKGIYSFCPVLQKG